MSVSQLLLPAGAPVAVEGGALFRASIAVVVKGEILEPSPKGRPRATIFAGRARVGMDVGYRRWLREALALFRARWGMRPSIAVPVRVEVVAVFERPAKPVRFVTVGGVKVRYPWTWTEGRNPYLGTGGDCDNVAGAVLDAMLPPPKDLQPRKKDPPGLPPLLDDRLVVELSARQFYAATGETAHAEVVVWAAFEGGER